MAILVIHREYGCETGCCGHYIEVDGKAMDFDFTHPNGDDHLEWAKQWVEEQCGPEHVGDLDWENSVVIDD